MPSQRSVLIVDDNDDVRPFLRQALADRGYQADGAASATEALDRARRGAIDVAVVDLVLRGAISGEHLAAILATLGIRVIMISGLVNAAERLSLLPYPFLVKPFRLAALTGLIEAGLGGPSSIGGEPRAAAPLDSSREPSSDGARLPR